MRELARKVLGRLHFTLEQVQDLTPTPMTLSSVMFYTGENPYTHEKVYVARTQEEKRRQKSYFFGGRIPAPAASAGRKAHEAERRQAAGRKGGPYGRSDGGSKALRRTVRTVSERASTRCFGRVRALRKRLIPGDRPFHGWSRRIPPQRCGSGSAPGRHRKQTRVNPRRRAPGPFPEPDPVPPADSPPYHSPRHRGARLRPGSGFRPDRRRRFPKTGHQPSG